MPWKETNTMDERLEFVVRTFEKNVNFTRLCKEFSISTKTGYKWVKRFHDGGKPNLADQTRRPISNARSIPPQMVYDIIKIKHKKKQTTMENQNFIRCIIQN